MKGGTQGFPRHEVSDKQEVLFEDVSPSTALSIRQLDEKKLNSISRERLNFRRQPILCTTLDRNPIQASNFGGAFDQLFLRIFMQFFAPLLFYTFGAKKSKMTKNSNRGSPAFVHLTN